MQMCLGWAGGTVGVRCPPMPRAHRAQLRFAQPVYRQIIVKNLMKSLSQACCLTGSESAPLSTLALQKN